MVLPSSLSVNGKVSPLALAIAAGRNGEPRPAQLAMKESLSIWIDEGKSGLVEAPTGMGKSYAMLASALEWLDADRSNKVVIATFTKQLQSQLADDIQALAQVIPGLDDVSDLVKGKGNRMSMRALVTALSDVTVAASQPRRGRQAAFARDIKFRELLAYLALRLMAPASLSEGWEVRSVDGPDIPAFFTDYCGGRLYAYLASLSQAAAGEYGPRSGPLALFTDDVAEAISNHRLIVANHALLLSNLDDLVATSETTLLMIDEAHMLEDAATNSMTFDVDSDEFEQLPNDVWRMLPDFRGSVGIDNYVNSYHTAHRDLGVQAASRQAREYVDRRLSEPDGILSVVSGKAILAGLATWSQGTFGATFGSELVARSMWMEEISAEIRVVLSAIEKSSRFDAGTSASWRARAEPTDST
jgi:ATP-dependent DNA helicase RecQ